MQAGHVGGDHAALAQRHVAGLDRLQQHLKAALGLLTVLEAREARCGLRRHPLPAQERNDVDLVVLTRGLLR